MSKEEHRFSIREGSGPLSPNSIYEKQREADVASVLTEDSSLATLNEENPFADEKIAEYYRQIYEDCQYECRGVFDPSYKWTPEQEKKVIRKLDFRVALTSCILFVALQVDRGNLTQAVSDNMLSDLNMNTDDYNLGNTLFLVAFLVAELPMSLLSKKIGPDKFIPFQIIGFSLIALFQFFLVNKAGFLVTRVLLGFIEGSLIADLVIWLSYFYKSKELPIRLSWFWTTLALVQIITSLLAFGILRMRGVSGKAGWRWLFLIEGLFTFIIGIAGFYLMVPSAVQTKNRFHPKGWFNDDEIKIIVNRVLRDDPSKGDMHNRQAVDWNGFLRSLTDYDLWPIYAIGILSYISSETVAPYLTLTLKQIGFNTFNTNLLVIPSSVIHIILLLTLTWVSERVSQISLLCLVVPAWNLPILGVLAWWGGTMKSVWGTWVLYTLLVGQPYIHAMCVSWVSRNSNSIRTRSISAALYNISVQICSIAAKNIYRKNDAPVYRTGNRNLFILTVALIPLYLLVKLYYVLRNRHKERLWNQMTPEEQHEYLLNNKHLGNKRLDFRFAS